MTGVTAWVCLKRCYVTHANRPCCTGNRCYGCHCGSVLPFPPRASSPTSSGPRPRGVRFPHATSVSDLILGGEDDRTFSPRPSRSIRPATPFSVPIAASSRGTGAEANAFVQSEIVTGIRRQCSSAWPPSPPHESGDARSDGRFGGSEIPPAGRQCTIRRASTATTIISSAGTTGLGRGCWNPACIARRRTSARAYAVSATAGTSSAPVWSQRRPPAVVVSRPGADRHARQCRRVRVAQLLARTRRWRRHGGNAAVDRRRGGHAREGGRGRAASAWTAVVAALDRLHDLAGVQISIPTARPRRRRRRRRSVLSRRPERAGGAGVPGRLCGDRDRHARRDDRRRPWDRVEAMGGGRRQDRARPCAGLRFERDERAERAERANRAGRLLYAADTMAWWRACLEARRKNVAVSATTLLLP